MRQIRFLIIILALMASANMMAFAQTSPGNATQKDAAADDAYNALARAYMASDFEHFDELIGATVKYNFKLNAEQRRNFEYIRNSYRECRPNWWPRIKSSRASSFQISLWGKTGMANFEPGDNLGETDAMKIINNRIITVVHWRPQFVDSAKPIRGILAKKMDVYERDFAETIAWHELGHTYVFAWIPASNMITMIRQDVDLVRHLQEFYADMSAIRHASPKSRLLTLSFRLDELDPPFSATYRTQEAHTRGSHGIGAMLLSEFLTNPGKWPNVHFPPAVPGKDIELKTITYVYEHFDENWSVNDDHALRDFAQNSMAAHGLRILQSGGKIPLNEGQAFALMYREDEQLRQRRDKWVAQKLQKIIASGRADKANDAESPAELKKKAAAEIGDIAAKVGPYRNPYRFMLPVE